MKKLKHILFLSCLKTTELIEKKIRFGLSWVENLQLRFHKSMCDACRNYEKQNQLLEDGLSELIKREGSKTDLKEVEKSILEKLKQ
ncbi:MAG: hypothetical protein ACE5D7_05085 [Fidelibacterota bacterium]